MATCYLDANGNYFSIQGVDPAEPTCSLVYTTGPGQGRGTLSMPTATVTANIASLWTVAEDLSDIGGGVWFDGRLVDPEFAQ